MSSLSSIIGGQEDIHPLYWKGDLYIRNSNELKLHQQRVEFLSSYLSNKENLHIVELGCNVGFEAIGYARSGFKQVTAIDIRSSFIDVIQRVIEAEKLENLTALVRDFSNYITACDVVISHHTMPLPNIYHSRGLIRHILSYSPKLIIDASPSIKWEPYDPSLWKFYQSFDVYKAVNVLSEEFTVSLIDAPHAYLLEVERRTN